MKKTPQMIKTSISYSLRNLAKVPIFNLIFFEIADIVRPKFKQKKFIAALMPENYLLGVFDIDEHPTWKQMVETDYETNEVNLLKRVLPLVDCFFDIGAHIGIYTCLVSRLTGIPVYAFEPNKDNANSLSQNIKLNKFNNVKLFRKALGRGKVKKSFLYSTDSAGSLIPGTFKVIPINRQKVEIDTLDAQINLVKSNSSILMKIDVEGGEYDLLQGGRKFFKILRPNFILIEIVKYWGGGENKNFNNTFQILKEMGYISYSISNSGTIRPKEMKSLSQLKGGDYFFVHQKAFLKFSRVWKKYE